MASAILFRVELHTLVIYIIPLLHCILEFVFKAIKAGSIQFLNHQTRGSTCTVMAPVSNDCVIALAADIGKDWIKLGIVLGLKNKAVDRISENYNSDVWEKAYRILREWQEQKGSGATYEVLDKALKHQTMRRVDLAEKWKSGDTRNTNGKSFACNCTCKIFVPPQ